MPSEELFLSNPLSVKAGSMFHLSLPELMSDALALASAARRSKSQGERVVVVCADPADVVRLKEEMKWFAPDLDVRSLPDWETLPYDVMSPQEDLVSERLETLYRMSSESRGLDVLLVSAVTAAQRLAPASYIQGNTFFFKVGQTISMQAIVKDLVKAGYANVKQVLAAGEFTVKGEIIDVFPMGSEKPFRLDFFDDEIESIKWFDVESQRSMEKVDSIKLLPGHEFPVDEQGLAGFRERYRQRIGGAPRGASVYSDAASGLLSPGIEYYLPLFFDETAVFADYLPEKSRIYFIGSAVDAISSFMRDTESRHKMLASDPARPALNPMLLWQNADEFMSAAAKFPRLQIVRTPSEAPDALQGARVERKSQNPIDNLLSFAAALPKTDSRLLICASSPGREETMYELFRSGGLQFASVDSYEAFLASSARVALCASPLYYGCVVPSERIKILTESELYEASPRRARARRSAASTNVEMMIRDVSELKIGDPVVHVEHGIGRYQGLKVIDTPEGDCEFLEIEYKGEARLFVPIQHLNLISRYAGSDPAHAPLHQLGRGDWEKARRKAAEEVRDTAAELLELYAVRSTRQGHKFSCTIEDYDAFRSGFAFEETPDQAAAIEAVLSDMKSGKSMDRLVCGDVGFGKTEVALRAAFLAAMSGKQVAVLCPTTLLAEQHASTFKERFKDWPVSVKELSRFRTGRETAAVLEGLEKGSVDIVIGTHKLLGGKVKFADLGLIIIDEEHRFGVRQKEALRKLRAEVDVLTLTATPIPRTLSMSLEGIRDFSVIATAPEKRLSVKTIVKPEENGLIREAVLRELKRGGQVYFLHNEVDTIQNRFERLKELIPEARITVGHGQMSERELERVMRDFYQQKFNVLLCTTIIETGIDVPSANTIVISRADKLGLAQLHQLRGRVGRSHHQAYAYLLTPAGGGAVTKDAELRLNAIQSMENLGSGFYLAMHDLEIRGAGEVLGEHQSGEIAEVGFDLYNKMLLTAVKAMKRGEAPDLERALTQTTDIDLHAPALLPSSYVSDVSQRLAFYKEFTAAEDRAALEKTTEKLADCYGKLPDPARRLVASHRLRLKCEAVGIKKIDSAPTATVITFHPDAKVEPKRLIEFLQTRRNARMAGPERLRIEASIAEAEKRASMVEDVIAFIAPAALSFDAPEAQPEEPIPENQSSQTAPSKKKKKKGAKTSPAS